MIGMMKGRALVLEAGLCQRHLGHASLFVNSIYKYVNGLLETWQYY